MPMIKRHSAQKQAGFSIIDVMFAIFVFSIGILGIAGLQVLSKKSNYEAVQRTTAVFLANDIVERMRANSDKLIDYQVTFSYKQVLNETPPATLCTGTVDCTAAELAAYDLWQWKQAVVGATDKADDGTYTGGLVQPSACISVTSEDVTVAIAWRGQTPTSDPTASDCGRTSGLYGADNEFRQLFVLNSQIETSF